MIDRVQWWLDCLTTECSCALNKEVHNCVHTSEVNTAWFQLGFKLPLCGAITSLQRGLMLAFCFPILFFFWVLSGASWQRRHNLDSIKSSLLNWAKTEDASQRGKSQWLNAFMLKLGIQEEACTFGNVRVHSRPVCLSAWPQETVRDDKRKHFSIFLLSSLLPPVWSL